MDSMFPQSKPIEFTITTPSKDCNIGFVLELSSETLESHVFDLQGTNLTIDFPSSS